VLFGQELHEHVFLCTGGAKKKVCPHPKVVGQANPNEQVFKSRNFIF